MNKNESQDNAPEIKHNVELTQHEVELLVTVLMATVLDCGIKMQTSENPLEQIACMQVGMESVEMLKRLEQFLPKEVKETSIGAN
jgi:hypothetical protein